MHGSSALTLTLLLSLEGLCRGQWNVQRGILPKPFISADPSTIVNVGTKVTIFCQGSRQPDVYYLYKGSSYIIMTLSTDTSGYFTFFSIHAQDAAQYQCVYHSLNIKSQPSDPLFLTVTGVYPPSRPVLSAHPSSLVAAGEKVALLCTADYTVDTFHLLKEGRANPSTTPLHRISESSEKPQALFLLDPVRLSHGGAYRCYGSSSSYPHVWSHSSDTLHLHVTGVYTKPSLSAQPGSLVQSGGRLTLKCLSGAGFRSFALMKNESLPGHQNFVRQQSPSFVLNPVDSYSGGQYWCYSGKNLYEWSEPSDPLDIMVAGRYRKPYLSALLGPSVTSGEKVTLQCRSEEGFDTFYLYKDNHSMLLQRLTLQNNNGPYQVNFTISPVTSAHEGTYMCYTSHSSSPYLWSYPSDPLQLVVSGSTEEQHHEGMGSEPPSGLPRYLKLLIGVLVAFILLVLVSLLTFFFIRHRHQRKHRTTRAQSQGRSQPNSSSPATENQEENVYAAVKDKQPEEEMELHSQQSPEDEDPQAMTSSQVNHHSKMGQVVATCSSMSGDFENMKGRQGAADRQRDSQDAVSEDPQEITYAELDHLTLRRDSPTPPSSQSRQTSNEPHVYAALATH